MLDGLFESESFLSFFSAIALISTVCLFLTGLEICWRIRTYGTTDGIGSAPFHMGVTSGALWLQYGMLKGDTTIVYVNTISLILYIFYVSYYYWKTSYPRKKLQQKLIAVEVTALALLYYYVNYSGDAYYLILTRLGYCCVAFNIATVGAPLLALGEVIRSRSTETLPLPLCLANLLVTSEWLIYGFLVNDFFIKLPNAIAVVMAVAQVVPFLFFPRRKQYSVVREH